MCDARPTETYYTSSKNHSIRLYMDVGMQYTSIIMRNPLPELCREGEGGAPEGGVATLPTTPTGLAVAADDARFAIRSQSFFDCYRSILDWRAGDDALVVLIMFPVCLFAEG